MEKTEVKKVIQTIVAAYPRFLDEKTEYHDVKVKLKFWSDLLLDRDFSKTMKNVRRHIESSSFEPTLHDILPPVEKNDSLADKLKELK